MLVQARANRYGSRMDNLGDSFLPGFWQGFGLMVQGIWEAMLEHPWLFLVFGFVIVGGLFLQFAPRRGTRRSR
jgi:hypothetical protein